MSVRHHPDLVLCRKQPGIGTTKVFLLNHHKGVGKLCDKCDGRCPICDSHVRPTTQVRICDECNFGPQKDRCIICQGPNATNEAFYCKECCLQEKDRDGCPRVINVGSARLDAIFERKKYTTKTT